MTEEIVAIAMKVGPAEHVGPHHGMFAAIKTRMKATFEEVPIPAQSFVEPNTIIESIEISGHVLVPRRADRDDFLSRVPDGPLRLVLWSVADPYGEEAEEHTFLRVEGWSVLPFAYGFDFTATAVRPPDRDLIYGVARCPMSYVPDGDTVGELTIRDHDGNKARFLRHEDGRVTVHAPEMTYITPHEVREWLWPCICSIDYDYRCPLHGDDDNGR